MVDFPLTLVTIAGQVFIAMVLINMATDGDLQEGINSIRLPMQLGQMVCLNQGFKNNIFKTSFSGQIVGNNARAAEASNKKA